MGTRLYVGNLSFQTTEDALRSLLSEDGRNVKEVFMVSDRETGRPRGFAFAEMATDQDAQSAIEALDGLEFEGRNLRVNEAQERAPRPGGGGGGGGFRPRGNGGGSGRGGPRGGGDRDRGARGRGRDFDDDRW